MFKFFGVNQIIDSYNGLECRVISKSFFIKKRNWLFSFFVKKDNEAAVTLRLLKSASFLLFLLTSTTGEGFFRRVEVRSCLE